MSRPSSLGPAPQVAEVGHPGVAVDGAAAHPAVVAVPDAGAVAAPAVEAPLPDVGTLPDSGAVVPAVEAAPFDVGTLPDAGAVVEAPPFDVGTFPDAGAVAVPAVEAGLVEVDALPDAVLIVGADRRILVANTAAVGLFGYSRDELVGAPCALLIDAHTPDGAAVWAGDWDGGTRLRSVRRLAGEVVTVRPRGAPPISVVVTGAYRRNRAGVFVGLVLCFRPSGHRADVASGIEVVSAVGHELRSPLTSIKGYTSLLLNRWDELTDDDKRMMLGQVNRDADRVTRLIGELLDISRLESGRLRLRRQMVDLPALTDSVLDRVRFAYPEIEARVVWPADFPVLRADPDKIEQVLTNLLENACKYASPRKLVISGEVVTSEPARDDPTAGRPFVAVTVADRGPGIPADDLVKVFARSFRRSEGRPDGSGLGLWISRGLVELHGGRLTATSIPGEGSAFRFTLPVVDLEDHTTP